MGVKERRARQKKFLRQEILDAASELFVREGYEDVSMRRIAEKIEYSPTTIYLHFRDKAELLEEVCEDLFARLSQVLAKISAQAGDPIERLKRGMLAYVRFGLENPHPYRAIFMMPVPEGFEAKPHSSEDGSSGMQAFDFMRRAVHDCIAAGNFKRTDAELISQTLWAGIHGITSLLIVKSDHFPFVEREKLIGSVVDVLVAGVAKG